MPESRKLRQRKKQAVKQKKDYERISENEDTRHKGMKLEHQKRAKKGREREDIRFIYTLR
jgi:hypothetical protein